MARTKTSNKPTMRTRARLINQLGRQLIKSESIALLELVKNSYDADAVTCEIDMYSPESKAEGRIVITDDGEGMDYKTLSTAWLEIGTSYKEDLLADDSTARSPRFKRRRLGEKGIGRFGVHRLGETIEVVTRKKSSKECVLSIDWTTLDESEYVEQIPIKISQRAPRLFKNSSGTRITIQRLVTPWTRKMARDSKRAITALNPPFEEAGSFRATFTVRASNWLEGLLEFKDIDQYKLFSFDLTLIGDKITKFKYEFTPWNTMKKLSPRRVGIRDREVASVRKMVVPEDRKKRDVDLSQFEIGEVRFRGIIFDRDPRVLKLGVQDRQGLKQYLNENGGVRVYRDKMRVLDYGEPGNDWLDLGGRRINIPTKRISNNLIIAAVYLDRSESNDLEEKANREGFVETEAYRELWRAIRFAIERVEVIRKVDKDLLRLHYGPQKVSEPVRGSISELKLVVEKSVKSLSTREEITRYLDRIEAEYESITEVLIRGAGAGLNLVVVIHQMEKVIKEIRSMLKERAAPEVVEERVRSLAQLVEGYSILIKKSDKRVRNVKGIVEQGVFNESFRLEAHGIRLIPAFRERIKNLDGICSVDHALNGLMNVIDNSIWWLGYSKPKDPTILVDISNELKGFVTVIIADNGPGFSLSTSEIVKPWVTNKPGGSGIGLHLTDQIMQSLNGMLIFPEPGDYDIPRKFRKGAITALAFKKG